MAWTCAQEKNVLPTKKSTHDLLVLAFYDIMPAVKDEGSTPSSTTGNQQHTAHDH